MFLDPDKRVDLAAAAGHVRDGAIVALGGGLSARLPMALVREMIRQGRRDLHVVGSAHGIDVDMLIGAGAIAICEEKLRRLRAGLRTGARVPAGGECRHDHAPGELLRHNPHPAEGRGDGPAVPPGERHHGHGHEAPSP